MVTILLQKIIELLTGFFENFVTWANNIGDAIFDIRTHTSNLSAIRNDLHDTKLDVSIISGMTGTIQMNTTDIAGKVTTIRDDTAIIKNNAGSIATSSGTTAAFAEDIANNTLDMDNRLVTIGSDTTQIRADSGNIAADVAEIKDTLGLYLYNTIVTEDAEGDIALCDTDLKDYLQEAKVTIPADAGGITGINVIQCGVNIWDEQYEAGTFDQTTGAKTASSSLSRNKNPIAVKPNTNYYWLRGSAQGRIFYYDESMTLLSSVYYAAAQTITTPANCFYVNFAMSNDLFTGNEGFNYPAANTTYNAYTGTIYPITFTSITDGAEIDLLTGLIKINTSPVTYDSITPIAIRTYKGINNFYSDIGTTSVTYRETLKHYLKKQEA